MVNTELITPKASCVKSFIQSHTKYAHKSVSDLLELCEEVVDHMFDLRGLGREQDQLLIGQVELQHVLRWNRHKQDVRVAAQEVIRQTRKSASNHRSKQSGI